ncbi:hypothetical protein J2Y69_003230 [Microbacterium resistens]|uniref:Uncharacterized protein n=1 Tax=Microbacterium resistens TaxID=156977 RepID=A0ABU1SG75_9MICO|nr:hypothetical protein [Microbacterium resistens]MDR6868606.1 hypothetical protein [Microbacterium resistens]
MSVETAASETQMRAVRRPGLWVKRVGGVVGFAGGVIGIIGGIAGVMFGLPGYNRATGDPLVVTYGVQLISVGGVSDVSSGSQVTREIPGATSTMLVSNRSDRPVTVANIGPRDAPDSYTANFTSANVADGRPVTDTFDKRVNLAFVLQPGDSAWVVATIGNLSGSCGPASSDCAQLDILTGDEAHIRVNLAQESSDCTGGPDSPCGRLQEVWEAALASPQLRKERCVSALREHLELSPDQCR